MGWSASTYSPAQSAWRQQHSSEALPTHPSPRKLSSFPNQCKTKALPNGLKIALNFMFQRGRRGESVYACFSMSKGLTSLRGKHRLMLYMFMSERFRRRGRQHCVSQVKRMHKCVGNGRKFVKTLPVFGKCYGAEVHYLNSSKHRKLIELR